MPTIEEIMAMDEEELKKENARLAKIALKRFLLLHGLKWAIIIGSAHALKRYLNKAYPADES